MGFSTGPEGSRYDSKSPQLSRSTELSENVVSITPAVSNEGNVAKDDVLVQTARECVVPCFPADQKPVNFWEKFFSFEPGKVLWNFAKFMGPGAVIAVAYIDPDNYQGDASAGAAFKYRLLFMVLFANIVSVYLQALSCKLGCVTGKNLAQMNRIYLPPVLNIAIWLMIEAAIVCADISQVIGTALALNLLQPKIPLIAGCAISVADTLFILLFYRADGTIRQIRAFEAFVSIFIIIVFVLFCVELSFISAPVGQVFRGYVPSKEIFVGQGLYQSCAILGGTLMPHAIYLGSGLVQAKMMKVDQENGTYHESKASDSKYAISLYQPTLTAIKTCMSYTIAELCTVLFIVGTFVNSAILIIAAASLSEEASEADIPGLYNLFATTIGQSAATIFALALLFSGISAGIVTTMTGQMVAEGAFNWRMSPYLRRFLTRCLAVIPAMVVAAASGQRGLANALLGTDVARSVTLIFVTFPLIWYTSFDKYMMVTCDESEGAIEVLDHNTERESRVSDEQQSRTLSMANGWFAKIVGFTVWLLIAGLNVTTLVFLGLGIGDD